MKYYLINILFIALFTFVASCNDDDTITKYEDAVPKTETGARLVENTNLFATIFRDSTYAVTEGALATELHWLSMKGQAMHAFIFEIDLSSPNVSLEVSTPSNKVAFGMQKMTEQALYEDASGHSVWGGVNGDFFNTTSGVPQGILYKDGVAIKTSFQDDICTYFAITKDGKALVAGQDEFNELKGTFQEALGGRASLVKDGIVVSQTNNAVEPRTCIGVSEDGETVYIMVVDGRNFSYSSGMDYSELSQCMIALGAYDAINLDGGGSSTFFIRNTPEFIDGRFEIRNWPTDNGGAEREVANGLLIISNN